MQTGLIDKVLKASVMNKAKTLISNTNISVDKDGKLCQEERDYTSIFGTLMYLENNSRLNIVFVVNQYTWFTYYSKDSHAVRVKCIL